MTPDDHDRHRAAQLVALATTPQARDRLSRIFREGLRALHGDGCGEGMCPRGRDRSSEIAVARLVRHLTWATEHAELLHEQIIPAPPPQ